jgi:hypothetical protein
VKTSIIIFFIFFFNYINSQNSTENIIKYKVYQYTRQDLNLRIERVRFEKNNENDFIYFNYNKSKNEITISRFFDGFTFQIKQIEVKNGETWCELYENMFGISRFIIKPPSDKNNQIGEIYFSTGWLINDIFRFQ